MNAKTVKATVRVQLTVDQVRSIFAAINTAGMLSAGRVKRQPADATHLLDAIARLERATGLDQSLVDEWVLN